MSNKVKIREEALQLNIIDDAMFTKAAEDKDFCEELLRTIIRDPFLMVIENVPQAKIQNLQGRSVILDVKCTLSNGKIVEVEVENADNDDHQRRVRYNSSVLTANIVNPGEYFRDIPDVIVIYISRFDIFDLGKAIYHVNRVIEETNTIVKNGLQEIYVNAAIDDRSDIAALMKVFTEDSTYDNRFPAISKQKRIYKTTEGGIQIMCDIIKRNREEAAQDAIKNTTLENLKSIIKKLNLSPNAAMDILNIPTNMRKEYLALL